jgi:UDPglucose 6-dehydrogenase
VSFAVLSNPEFLSQGSALKDLLQPWIVLIGSAASSLLDDLASAALRALYESWVPEDGILTVHVSSSELVKIANNALEAQRISSINSLSAMCEVVGADVQDISRACGLNPRIGPFCLQAVPGFGGSCFKKDVLGLVGLAESMSLTPIAEYWRQVLLLNELQISRVAAQICQLGSLSVGRKVAILGFAFKKDTGDARGSLAKDVILLLVMNNITVTLLDGLVPKQDIVRELGFFTEAVRVYDTPYEACEGMEVVVIMNDAQQYQELEWARISAGMVGNRIVVDSKQTTNAKRMRGFGSIIKHISASNWLSGVEAIENSN